MRVLVTGATGFLGSHTVAALTRGGHDVRILARNPDRVDGALGPHGVHPDVAVGDMTDPAAVGGAVAGCDAVIHAAAEIGVAGGTGTTTTNNVDGARTVIGAAIDAGCDPVIYTSSLTVHLPTTEAIVTPDSPLAEPLSSYGASKLAAEQLVRAWQAKGAPITSFTLGGIYGPVSPHRDGSFAAILGALGSMMVVPPGGLGVVDVRDVATMLVAALEPGPRTAALPRRRPVRHVGRVDRPAQPGRRPRNPAAPDDRRRDHRNGAHLRRPARRGQGVAAVRGGGGDHDQRRADRRLRHPRRSAVPLPPVVETFTDTVRYLGVAGQLPAPGA